MILGLVGNPTKKALAAVLPKYLDWLDEKKINYILSSEFEVIKGLHGRDMIPPEDVSLKADIILSFGGDGTLLNSIRLLKGRETPVVGVNLGGLGYLTDVGSGELYRRTQDLFKNRWSIERRIILQASLVDDSEKRTWYALNDIVVDKGGYSRMIRLRTTINGQFLNTFRADGLIIATPTGSTGYSLSSGGPIVEPAMAGILVNPINPHSLSNRPLMISDDKEIQVEAHIPSGNVVVCVDGQEACTPESGRVLSIKRAKFSACLINFEGRYFYDVLRQKLGWGDI